MSTVKMFLFAGLFLSMMSISSVGQAHVLDGAKEWNGHYYKIFPMQMQWNEAKNFCESVGGHLATAETQAENEMLKSLILKQQKVGNEYWIGGYCKNNIWRWIGGKIVSDYFDWSETPFSSDNARIYMAGYNEIKWGASYDNYQKLLICEWDSANNAHESNM